MPEIDLIPTIFYQPLDPYNWVYDNLPIQNLSTRQELLSDAVDINSQILRDSIGTQGTLANRLNQSLNPDGSLITAAVDQAYHNIGAHDDGSVTVSSSQLTALTNLGYNLTNPVPFVRMLASERAKLANISSGATALRLQVQTGPSTITLFDNQTVELANSDSLTWEVSGANKIQGNFALPLNLSHSHFYNLMPVAANVGVPDYINYRSTSVNTAYTPGSLRVTINGISLNETASVYVPLATGPSGTWSLTTYTENAAAGTFALNRAITSADIIRISFDVAY